MLRKCSKEIIFQNLKFFLKKKTISNVYGDDVTGLVYWSLFLSSLLSYIILVYDISSTIVTYNTQHSIVLPS